MAIKQSRRSVSMSRRHYNKLTSIAEQGATSKAKVIEELIDKACDGRMSIKDAAASIIATHERDDAL